MLTTTNQETIMKTVRFVHAKRARKLRRRGDRVIIHSTTRTGKYVYAYIPKGVKI